MPTKRGTHAVGTGSVFHCKFPSMMQFPVILILSPFVCAPFRQYYLLGCPPRVRDGLNLVLLPLDQRCPSVLGLFLAVVLACELAAVASSRNSLFQFRVRSA